jgi:hypothetical protein
MEAMMIEPRHVAACALSLAAALCSATAAAQDVRVTISGEVVPGVYGQVEIGSRPPPPVVYEQPVVIVKQHGPQAPIYLHVPPGHARNWSKHCRKYKACNRPVYFVKSVEYEPGYRHPGRGAGTSEGRGRGRGRN